ncbi:MAG: hypothetical protein K6B65_00150 [Bacilli bacterium]|nr:hypothetical protein [Bacilli bacterium]
MTNFQIYKKVLSFSFLSLLIDLAMLALVSASTVIGFFIGQGVNAEGGGFVGAVFGLIVGAILFGLAGNFASFTVNAAQIAMITEGVTTDKMPDHTFKSGFQAVKARFGAITALFFIIRAIKSVFRQLGRGINKIGTAVGGDVGNTVTSVIDGIIQTLIAYLCDCCLGWVLYRKDQNAARSACEGTVIFFKHGKTLLKNAGRIFGMGALSFILVGGALFGGLFLLFNGPFNGAMVSLYTELGKLVEGELGFSVIVFVIMFSAIGAIVLWSILHGVLGHPFILVGVLRNYIQSGIGDTIKESDFADVEAKAPKFGKLVAKANEGK